MKKIALKNFKAHKVNEHGEHLEIDLEDGKNFLLYGDNGSGKSSIYDALKVSFFTNKVEPYIADIITSDEREVILREFWQKYNNTVTGEEFDIIINDEEHQVFDSSSYSLFMLSLDELYIEDSIRLDELLKKFYFDIEDVDALCLSKSEAIQESVNLVLKENFREEIQIVINNEDNYGIIIKDSRRNLSSRLEIKKYFNEAKLNLVLLLLLFESIKASEITTEKKILVLDDFITSLDVANRTFLMRYIFDNFSEFQILIFTHNVYFYNLIMYLVNDIYKQKDKWHYANLYEIGNEHKLYMNNNLIELPKLRKKFYGQNPDYQTIGNQLRQKFERLLYEFSKILMIGGVEESNKILEILDKSKNIYLVRDDSIDIKKKEQVYKNSNDLVLEIEELIINNSTVDDIKSKIIEYKEIDNLLPDILKIIRELKLYQKVSMHSLSHGQLGQNPISQKEIEKSLELLEVFQKHIQFLVNKKVDGA